MYAAVRADRFLRDEEERDAQYDVYGEQKAFIPVGSTVLRNGSGNEYGDADGDQFQRGEHEIHRIPEEEADEHEHGSDEQGDLQVADGNFNGGADFVLHRQHDGDCVRRRYR